MSDADRTAVIAKMLPTQMAFRFERLDAWAQTEPQAEHIGYICLLCESHHTFYIEVLKFSGVATIRKVYSFAYNYFSSCIR